MEIFVKHLFTEPGFYLCWVGSMVVSICVHEFCHAFTAHKLGDDTAYSGGYMTFNPLKVMGWVSLVCLVLFGICWGAVPVCKDDVRRPRMSAISLAGPLSNFVLAFFFSILLRIVPCMLFTVACYANCMLFIFNILPIPILDGWGVLEPFFPPMQKLSQEKRTKYSNWAIFILWFSPASVIMDKLCEALASVFIPWLNS